jgi:hypothetical protein
MTRARPDHAELWQEVVAWTVDESTVEEVPLLLIDELEARLTPDSPFGSSMNNSQPPGGQVGWGC